jgi:hypothetical protein
MTCSWNSVIFSLGVVALVFALVPALLVRQSDVIHLIKERAYPGSARGGLRYLLVGRRKIDVFAPIPRPRVSSTLAVKPGARRSRRKECFQSFT